MSEWKEAKWWEAANVLLAFPDRDYVKCLTDDKKWVNASSEMINEFNVKEFSEIKFRVVDFKMVAEKALTMLKELAKEAK